MTAPENQSLLDALARIQGGAGDVAAHMRALLVALVESTLVTGDEDGEPSLLEDEDGALMLALFATRLDFHFFDAGAPSAHISGADAIREIAAGTYDGLVLNPGPQQFELSREDVLDYFEVDED